MLVAQQETWLRKTLNWLQKPASRSFVLILCCSSDALSAVLDSIGCSFLSLYLLRVRPSCIHLCEGFSACLVPGGSLDSPPRLLTCTSGTIISLATHSWNQTASGIYYSSICTGVEQGKYRHSRSVTSHFMSSFEIRGWRFLNNPFKKVSTWHCYLLVLFFLTWFVLMVASKEDANLELYYFKQIIWDGNGVKNWCKRLPEPVLFNQTYQMLQIAQFVSFIFSTFQW